MEPSHSVLDERATVSELLDGIEFEMRRIRYWQVDPPRALDPSVPFAGVTFEAWLQFVYLPAVRSALRTGTFDAVPKVRIGLAALRQYDYHTEIPAAHELMRLCHLLEKALAPTLGL